MAHKPEYKQPTKQAKYDKMNKVRVVARVNQSCKQTQHVLWYFFLQFRTGKNFEKSIFVKPFQPKRQDSDAQGVNYKDKNFLQQPALKGIQIFGRVNILIFRRKILFYSGNNRFELHDITHFYSSRPAFPQ